MHVPSRPEVVILGGGFGGLYAASGARYISPRMAILLHDRYGVPVSDLLRR